MTPYQRCRQLHCSLEAALVDLSVDGRTVLNLMGLVFDDVLVDGRTSFAENQHGAWSVIWYGIADEFILLADMLRQPETLS